MIASNLFSVIVQCNLSCMCVTWMPLVAATSCTFGSWWQLMKNGIFRGTSKKNVFPFEPSLTKHAMVLVCICDCVFQANVATFFNFSG